MLDSTIPYYQSGLEKRLSYELTFSDYYRVIVSGKPDAKYDILDICLEYKIVANPRYVSDEYQNMVLLYDRILRQR